MVEMPMNRILPVIALSTSIAVSGEEEPLTWEQQSEIYEFPA